MEAIILLLNCLALFLLVVSGLRNDRRADGEPLMGPFHYTVDTPAPPAEPNGVPASPSASKTATPGWRQRAKTRA